LQVGEEVLYDGDLSSVDPVRDQALPDVVRNGDKTDRAAVELFLAPIAEPLLRAAVHQVDVGCPAPVQLIQG
jgi:hypothetical protein